MRGVERHYDQDYVCGVRLVDRVSTDVLCDRVSVDVKIENMIIQSLLRWYGHVPGGIISQILEVIEIQITGKRKNDRPSKSWEECITKDLERYGSRREYAHNRKKSRKQIIAKIGNPGQLE